MMYHNYCAGKHRQHGGQAVPSLSLSFISYVTTITLVASTIFNTPVSVQAQVQLPHPVCCMAYASSDENILYIHGGYAAAGTLRTQSSQFVALNLEKPSTWSTSNPPWEWPPNTATIPPPTASWHSMTIAKSRDDVFIWSPFHNRSAWWTYTITSRSWGNYATPINTTIEYGVKNGVDLNTGSVWIPGGNNNGTQMVMNVPGLSALPTFDMPLNYFPVPITHHSWTWSSVRNSFLHYGGRSVIGNITNPKLTEFSPLAGWAAVVTTGQPPGDVSGHCMVPAYKGNKMILFGGSSIDGIARADIYILDVPTRVWKMGKAATPEHARRYMACAVAGDSFVAWGGENDGLNMEVTPIVYDLVNDEWTTQFRRENLLKSATPFTPSPTATPIDTGSSKSTNAAAIGGGIAGGIVVVIIVVGLLLYRRRKQHRANVDRNINIVINNNNSIEKNEENTSPREPQDTDAQWYNKRNMYDTNAGVQPPPLKPHPVDNRDTFFKRFSTSPLTSPSLAGPQALMREPHKHLQSQSISSVKGYKTELVEDDEEIEQQRPLMPARLSNLSGTTAIVPPQTLPSNNSGPVKDVHNIEKNSNVATASITSRSPQTPTGVYLSYEGEGNRAAQTPRDPHSKSDIHSTIPDNVSAVQNQNPGDSLYIDRNDYLNRTQELSRMMDHIRAEQEELERSRREHEASMQRFNETQSFT